MSIIFYVRESVEEPKFPASVQHPDAVRYRVGNTWVDAIGEPTQEEVDAVHRPPPVIVKNETDKLLALLVEKSVIEQSEADTVKIESK